jgi:hypothetical protein
LQNVSLGEGDAKHVFERLDVLFDVLAIVEIPGVAEFETGILQFALDGPADNAEFVVGEQKFV